MLYIIQVMDLFNVSLQNFQAARSSIERLLAMKPLELRMDFCHADFTKVRINKVVNCLNIP
jgi:hypothetical protein